LEWTWERYKYREWPDFLVAWYKKYGDAEKEASDVISDLWQSRSKLKKHAPKEVKKILKAPGAAQALYSLLYRQKNVRYGVNLKVNRKKISHLMVVQRGRRWVVKEAIDGQP
jgi:hypothetical protein